MSSAPKDAKPAAAKPAAAKAPAKAAAKGKGAVKPAVKQTELRKKSKTPLVPKIVDPAVKAAQEKARKDKKAAKDLRNKQKEANKQARAAYARAVAEAKKKGVAPPPPFTKAVKTAKDKKVATKKVSKYAPNQRFYLKLTPLNEKFHSKFGFIFSELIGKSREKALCARNIHVVVTNPKHPLAGRVGKLRYYTGKHKAFVKIGHVMYKLPWSILGRSRIVHAEKARRAHRLRHAHRVANYVAHLKASKKNPKVKLPPQPKKTEFTAPPTVVYGKSKGYLKKVEKRKKAGKPVPTIRVKKAPAANAAPAVPFPNVGRPLKNRKAALRQLAAAEGKKKFQELKKAGKVPKRPNWKKLRAAKKAAAAAGTKPAAAAGDKTAAKPAAKTAAKPATKA